MKNGKIGFQGVQLPEKEFNRFFSKPNYPTLEEIEKFLERKRSGVRVWVDK